MDPIIGKRGEEGRGEEGRGEEGRGGGEEGGGRSLSMRVFNYSHLDSRTVLFCIAGNFRETPKCI